MKKEHYVIDKNHNISTVDLYEWAKWFESVDGRKNRIVKQDKVKRMFISTVFLGLDYDWGRTNKPILFETMVFDESKPKKHPDFGQDIYQRRYATYDEALSAHKKLVHEIKAGATIDYDYESPVDN